MYFSVYGFNLWILSPMLMTALFWFISIPLMENKILKTRPEYAEYQKYVSKLLFLPRKQRERRMEEID